MIVELGHLALILSLALAVVLAVVPQWGSWRGHQGAMALAAPLALMTFIASLLALAALVWAFIDIDLSVSYVANNANRALPLWYRISAVWGAHEGSLLLWVVVLTGWMAAVAVTSGHLPPVARARVLAVMGLISVGFLLFVIFTSNPFERTLPFVPADGHDLNPMLQDIGLIFHPPMLYMGYVGFSVAFAFAIAALLDGHLDSAWARWMRPWTLAAWGFLTLGIALGSWWAYYELGWGGWWFWDPVENASLMPWLVGTALIHSLAVTDQRQTFAVWSVWLAIAAFSLSLLGTFLVRSGVLVSVHAFATDPTRGLFILSFLVVVIGGSLTLFALRANAVHQRKPTGLLAREVGLLFNNLLLTAAMLVVLLGTLLPLVYQQLNWGSISIGPPFFNAIFLLLLLPFAVVMAVGPWLRWGKDELGRHRWRLLAVAAVALLAGLALYGWSEQVPDGRAVIGLVLAAALLVALLAGAWAQPAWRRLGYWGMVSGHVGFAIAIIGMVMVSFYAEERDLRMTPGQQVSVGGYQFQFDGVKPLVGPNYGGHYADVKVSRDGRPVTVLHAEKRSYPSNRQVMTEAAIHGRLHRDLYVALGEPLDGDAWALRIYVKPWVRLIWLGGLLVTLGAFLAMADKRLRRRQAAAEVTA
ncbi:MAG: heme lyase CcmF/NrfE family subunit [Gammaproteobacteria bacterium]|nr:heme lyase CcmF/NrfE family subunit [Gammaproteobacteria bacterium]